MMKSLFLILFLVVLSACQVSSDKPAGEIVTNHTNQTNSFSVTLPASGWKKLGDNIDVTLTFPINVSVTGTPTIPIVVGAANKNLTYVSGSGTKNLLFRYTVGATDLDTDGIEPASSLSLNGGTITYDFNGIKNANTTIVMPQRVIKVDGIVPTLVSQNSPPDGLYLTGTPLIYSLIYSEPVYVTGFPYFDISMSSGNVPASYASGSGSFNLNFLRIIRTTDIDQDGISSSGLINLAAGSIKDEAGNSVAAAIPVVNSPAVIINKTGPKILSITQPANGTYVEGQAVNFTVNFSESVNITGTPRLTLSLTTGIAYADYVSGSGTSSIVFRHTVLAGEQDLDGIVLSSPLDLNAGSIQSAIDGYNAILTYTPPTMTNVLVDARDPQVISVNSPIDGTYTNGQNLNFTLVFSEPVLVTGTPRLPFVLGAITKYLTYVSGSGSSALTFNYVVQSGDLDFDGIQLNGTIDLNSGTIKDLVARDAVLSFIAPTTTGIMVDAAPPQILLVTPPADREYKSGDILDFNFTFNKSVIVTGTPRLMLTIGATTRYANYLSGSSTSILKFRYVVQTGDNDSDGISLTSPLEANGGTIKYLSNDAILTFTLPNTSNVLVDTSLPTLNFITPPVAGTYGPGQDLTFTANFSKAVIVSGNPRIQLDIGGVTKYASYVSGSGSQNLTFKYNIQAGDSDLDGILHSSPIQLNSGTIRDIVTNDATLTFTPASTTNVLIDNVSPTIISITPPANGSYSHNQAMNFTVNFSETVLITGTPRIPMVVGASTVYLTYVSGNGTANAIFRYTPVLNQVDSDGVVLSSPLELNGGTIKDDADNNCNLSFLLPNTTSVLVNGTAPVISSVTAPSFKTYVPGENIDLIVNFNKNIIATGSPKLQLTIGSATVNASYHSGSGSSSLTFRYTVQSGDSDTDGIALLSPLTLSGGTLTDSGLNSSTLTFTAPDTSGVLVDGVAPVITSITPPVDSTYIDGNQLDFTVNWSEPVIVSGNPRFMITIGSSNVYATYISGSNSSALVFRYTVQSNDQDLDGITLTSPIDLNLGTIKDNFTNNAVLSFTAPNTSGVLVDVVQPSIISVVGPANGTYIENQDLDFTVTFNKVVNVTGSPRLNLTIGATTRYATYVSGSGSAVHTYRYTVQLGDYDTDGIVVASPLDLNAGTIKDNFNKNSLLTFAAPSLTSVLVDALYPEIASVIAPNNGTYEIGQNLDFTVNFNKAVTVSGTPRISLTMNSGSAFLNYVSGSGTAVHIYRYTIVANDLDTDGVAIASPVSLNGGTIRDSLSRNSALTFTAPNTTGVLVDGILPVITSVTAPANKTYIIGETIDFTVTMNKSITVTGTPTISLVVGATSLTASYLSGSGTNSHIYRYTVLTGHSDSDGIAVSSPIVLNGGTLKDAINQNLALTFTPPVTTGVLVDGVLPVISSVTGPANATYIENQNLDFTVTFNKAVIVTGTPRLALTIGATTRYATYVSGSGSTAHTYRYTVQLGDYDTDGIVVASPLDLNAGTIKDSINNNSQLTFTAPSLTSVLVDALYPVISSVVAPANATYSVGQTLDFTVNFNKPVTVTGTPRISLTMNSGSAFLNYVSGSGTAVHIYRYTIVANDQDTDGVAIASPVSLNGGTIRDSLSRNSALTFTAPNTTGVLVDGILPVITSVTAPANKTYIIGETIDFTVTMNKSITVTGTPTISLVVGATSLTASYLSGSGTNSHIYRYTVLTGHSDSDGIAVSSPIVLNGGTLKDAINQNLALTFTPPTTTSILVDGIRPTITSVTAPANKTYIIGETLDFIVNWSESVTVTGTPRLTLNVGGVTIYANYQSGSGSSVITFRYTVGSGELDTDGIAVSSPVGLNGGNFTDVPGNAVSVLVFTPPTTTSVLVDGVIPSLVSVTAPANGTYKETQNLTFTSTWSENVVVTGSPSITLDINGVSRSAVYVSGSGTSTLLFRYSLAASATDTGEEDLNGIGNSSPILLNGGTIKDVAGNSPASLVFTPPTTSGVLVDVKNPTITSITTPANFTSIKSGSSFSIMINFSEPITIATANPTIAFTINATARSLSCSQVTNATSTTCSYTIPAGNAVADLDLNGFSAVGSLTLGSSTIRDASSHNANITHSAIDLSKLYAVFSNTKMWVDFDQAELVTTATCGANMCVTGVTDKSSNGNNITTTTNPGPVLMGSGYGTGAAIGYAQFNSLSTVTMPNLTNVKYQVMVVRSHTSAAANVNSALIGGASPLLRETVNALGGTGHAFAVSSTLKQNASAAQSGTTVTRTWGANTNYIYQLSPGTISDATVTNYSANTIGSTSFSGRVVALLVMDNSATLTATQLDAITTQFNALYTAY